jgi:hypothetical protein
MVDARSACPIQACTVLRSIPPCRAWVANDGDYFVPKLPAFDTALASAEDNTLRARPQFHTQGWGHGFWISVTNCLSVLTQCRLLRLSNYESCDGWYFRAHDGFRHSVPIIVCGSGNNGHVAVRLPCIS